MVHSDEHGSSFGCAKSMLFPNLQALRAITEMVGHGWLLVECGDIGQGYASRMTSNVNQTPVLYPRSAQHTHGHLVTSDSRGFRGDGESNGTSYLSLRRRKLERCVHVAWLCIILCLCALYGFGEVVDSHRQSRMFNSSKKEKASAQDGSVGPLVGSALVDQEVKPAVIRSDRPGMAVQLPRPRPIKLIKHTKRRTLATSRARLAQASTLVEKSAVLETVGNVDTAAVTMSGFGTDDWYSQRQNRRLTEGGLGSEGAADEKKR